MASKYLRLMSPKGIARFPWLNKPDTKFSEIGDYKVDLVIPKADAEPLIKKVTSIRDQFAKAEGAKKKANLPFQKELDDQGKETGNYIVKFKVKARVGDWDRKPKLYDTNGQRIPTANIGSGSTLKVGFDVYTWNVASLGAGVTLQPIGVQIVDLVEFDDEGFKFDKEEGSFEGSNDYGLGTDVETSQEDEDEDVF